MDAITATGCVVNVVQYLGNVRNVFNMINTSKIIRASFGLPGTASIAKMCLREYFRNAMIRFVPPLLMPMFKKYNIKITGSSTICMFENIRKLGDFDLFVSDIDVANKVIETLIKLPGTGIVFKQGERSPVNNYVIGFVNTVNTEKYGKIDVIIQYQHSLSNYDLTICANAISTNGSYELGDITSLLNYDLKYTDNFKKKVKHSLQTRYSVETSNGWAKHYDHVGLNKKLPDPYEKLTDSYEKLLDISINYKAFIAKLKLRTEKYQRRGYICIDNPYSMTPSSVMKYWRNDLIYNETATQEWEGAANANM
jgi:hypothetical protein